MNTNQAFVSRIWAFARTLLTGTGFPWRLPAAAVFSLLLGLQPGWAANRAAQTAKDEAEAREVLSRYQNSLVLITGDKAKGSGFIAEFKGRKYLVTNAHVLAGNKAPRFTLLDRTPLKLGAAIVAVGHDILMLSVLEGGTGIPAGESVVEEAKVGDAVVVPGHAGGKSVINLLQGKIVGLGPERVEVSAALEPGVSGSPIIHLDTRKVIGVAAYYTTEPMTARFGPRISSLSDVRRFGWRLDSVARWEAVNWAQFHAQADALEKFQQTTRELAWAVDDFRPSMFRGRSHVYDSPAITSAINAYQLARTQNPRQSADAANRFLNSLRAVAQSGMALKYSLTYNYFLVEFANAEAERKAVMEQWDKLFANVKELMR